MYTNASYTTRQAYLHGNLYISRPYCIGMDGERHTFSSKLIKTSKTQHAKAPSVSEGGEWPGTSGEGEEYEEDCAELVKELSSVFNEVEEVCSIHKTKQKTTQ